MNKKIIYAIRICMSFIFLWAFFDKLFGLGFATTAERAWINRGSPTYGFLTNGTHGPFADFFQSLATVPATDWLFMIGLVGIGFSLLTGIAFRLGAISGVIMMVLMYFAAVPPENNPLIDDHIIYALVLVLLIFSRKTHSSAINPQQVQQ